jgi:hypothetical protein
MGGLEGERKEAEVRSLLACLPIFNSFVYIAILRAGNPRYCCILLLLAALLFISYYSIAFFSFMFCWWYLPGALFELGTGSEVS